jgi:hypothetical protein
MSILEFNLHGLDKPVFEKEVAILREMGGRRGGFIGFNASECVCDTDPAPD